MNKNPDIKNIFFLFCIHIIGHFLPLERSSIGQDGFINLLRESLWFNNFIVNSDRPLMFIWLEIHKYIIENYIFIDLYLIILLSFFPVLFSYIFLKILLKNIDLVFLIMILYSLMINKLELFHSSVNLHVIIVISIYLLSTISFMLFIEKNNKITYFVLSLICYSFAILWYEQGIFLPLIFLFYYYLKVNHFKFLDYTKIILPFVLMALIYLIYRFTGAFGFAENIGRKASFYNLIPGLLDVFHHHFGRYILRNFIYGIYLFFKINYFWLFLIIIADFLILIYIHSRIKRKNIYVDKKFIFFSLVLIFITLIPNIFSGSIGGRHLIMSSIGFSLILFFTILFFKTIWDKIYLLIVLIFLVVCQGNAWAQIVTLRIANSVYLTLNDYSKDIDNSKIVIIDKKSFADNIPFTMINRDFNVFNTYYGAQALEEWGLGAMVNMSLKNKNVEKIIYFSLKDINIKNNKIIFTKYAKSDYRKLVSEEVEILNDNVFILDYQKVYKDGYFAGKKSNF